MANDLEKRITAKIILDDSGFSSTLKGVNAELRNNKAELRATQSGLEAFGKTSENVKRVQDSMQRQLELQSKKVEVYKESINKANSILEKNIAEREKLKQAISQEESKLESLKKTYGSNNEAVQKSETRLKELQEQYNKTDSSIENNAKRIQGYETNLNKAEAEVNKATVAINKFNKELEKTDGFKSTKQKLEDASKKFESFGEKASKVGGTLSTHVSLPLLGVGVAAAKVGMDFEAEMSRVQAISGATGSQFDELEKQALDLGQSTAFSAGEVAEAEENLASAGFSVNETIEALPGLLDLAASSGEDLANSSDIAASTLRGFGLEANQAGRVADVLAKNAAATNAAVADTGEAMKYVAPNARNAGISLEETTAAIGLLANAGIKGSQAGTTLRSMLVRLAKPADPAAKVMKQLGFNAFDSSGKMKSLADIMGELNEKTKGLTDQEKQAAIATIFGQEALSGVTVLMQNGKQGLTDLTNELDNASGSADKMAKTMQNNTKSAIEQMGGALETAGIKILKALAPSIKEVAEVVGNLADKFSALSPSTQKLIVDLGLAAVATGPVIKGIGTISSGVGGMIKIGTKVGSFFGLFTKGAETVTSTASTVATAIEGTAAASTVATTGIGGLIASIGAIAGPALIATAAIAGIGVTGYAIYKKLNEQAAPAVDLFADKVTYSNQKIKNSNIVVADEVKKSTVKISNSTKQAVQSYLDLDKKATGSLMDLRIKSTAITKSQSTQLQKIYNDMGNKIKNGMKQKQNEDIKNLQDFFAKSKALSTKEEADILKKTANSWDDKKNKINQIQNQINNIIQNAANHHRQITDSEVKDIQKLQEQMKQNAVKTLSKNEVESKVILERMKDNDEHITAQMASDRIKQLNKLRDDSVKSANDEYNKRLAEIIRLRDESKVISKDQADKLIADARRQRDGTVNAAKETRNKAVNQIMGMDEQLKNDVNSTTGEMMTAWDRFKNWWSGLSFAPKSLKVYAEQALNLHGLNTQQHWSGTSYFKGGLTTLHERGEELYDLPTGTRIYNHEMSEQLVLETAKKTAQGIVDNFNSNNNGDTQIIVKNYLDSKEISSHTTKNVMRNMNNRATVRNLIKGY